MFILFLVTATVIELGILRLRWYADR